MWYVKFPIIIWQQKFKFPSLIIPQLSFWFNWICLVFDFQKKLLHPRVESLECAHQNQGSNSVKHFLLFNLWIKFSIDSNPHQICCQSRKISLDRLAFNSPQQWKYQYYYIHTVFNFRNMSTSKECEPKELQSFEKEILDAVQPSQNSLIYLPHTASHALISAGVIQKHIFFLADNKDQEEEVQSCEKSGQSSKLGDWRKCHIKRNRESFRIGASPERGCSHEPQKRKSCPHGWC